MSEVVTDEEIRKFVSLLDEDQAREMFEQVMKELEEGKRFLESLFDA